MAATVRLRFQCTTPATHQYGWFGLERNEARTVSDIRFSLRFRFPHIPSSSKGKQQFVAFIEKHGWFFFFSPRLPFQAVKTTRLQALYTDRGNGCWCWVRSEEGQNHPLSECNKFSFAELCKIKTVRYTPVNAPHRSPQHWWPWWHNAAGWLAAWKGEGVCAVPRPGLFDVYDI